MRDERKLAAAVGGGRVRRREKRWDEIETGRGKQAEGRTREV